MSVLLPTHAPPTSSTNLVAEEEQHLQQLLLVIYSRGVTCFFVLHVDTDCLIIIFNQIVVYFLIYEQDDVEPNQ